jgi:putative transcriptional regulator
MPTFRFAFAVFVASVSVAAVFVAALLLPAPALAQSVNDHAFLLVAKPDMLDPTFEGTVVLGVRPDESGPVGLILNRPTSGTLNSLFPNRPEFAKRTDRVYVGGPVEADALLFAFRSGTKPLKGVLVDDDIYISGFSEVLAEVLKHPADPARQRFFAGFSGWASGQLEDEIERGGWYVLRFDARALFEMNPRTLYEDMLKRATAPRIEASREVHAALGNAR